MTEGLVVRAGGLEEAARAGLLAERKWLPPKFLYDEVGSALFEAICAVPEYYLTRAERTILEQHAGDIASRLPQGVRLVELGAGSAVKTRLIIRELVARGIDVEYMPIDISEEAMRVAEANILSEFPRVRFRGVVDDWFAALRRLPHGEAPRLVLFLGSSIGNLDRAEAVSFLRRLVHALAPHDRLLLGTDMVKPVAELLAAYDDAAGVTAAFNRNLLVRLNQELGADFDVRAFRHEARWNGVDRRVEMHLVATRAQEVCIRRLDIVVAFASGESIHTENSHKYTPRDVAEMAEAAGLRVAGTWHEGDDRFRLNLLERP